MFKKVLRWLPWLPKRNKQASGGDPAPFRPTSPILVPVEPPKIVNAPIPFQAYNLVDTMDKTSHGTHLKLGLLHHEINVEKAPLMEAAPSATPLEAFTARKMRYTVSINGNFQTRETTCGKFSSEIAAFIKEQKGILVGVDGVNGYACGPTDQEILFWAHPLNPKDGNGRLVP